MKIINAFCLFKETLGLKSFRLNTIKMKLNQIPSNCFVSYESKVQSQYYVFISIISQKVDDYSITVSNLNYGINVDQFLFLL